MYVLYGKNLAVKTFEGKIVLQVTSNLPKFFANLFSIAYGFALTCVFMGTGKVFWLTHTHGKVYGLLFMAKIFSFNITTLLAILSLYHQIPLCNESTKLYHNSFTH